MEEQAVSSLMEWIPLGTDNKTDKIATSKTKLYRIIKNEKFVEIWDGHEWNFIGNPCNYIIGQPQVDGLWAITQDNFLQYYNIPLMAWGAHAGNKPSMVCPSAPYYYLSEEGNAYAFNGRFSSVNQWVELTSVSNLKSIMVDFVGDVYFIDKGGNIYIASPGESPRPLGTSGSQVVGNADKTFVLGPDMSLYFSDDGKSTWHEVPGPLDPSLPGEPARRLKSISYGAKTNTLLAIDELDGTIYQLDMDLMTWYFDTGILPSIPTQIEFSGSQAYASLENGELYTMNF